MPAPVRLLAALVMAALPLAACGGSGLVGIDGEPRDPLEDPQSRAIVIVFMAEDCPISNRYVPLLNRLVGEYSGRGVAMWSVYPNPGVTAETLEEHQRHFSIKFPALIDSGQTLVKRCGVEVTPEAVVFVPAPGGAGGVEMVYRGRIDDQYFDFGKWRPRATKSDLEEVLDAVIAGERPPFRETRAVGCYIVKS